MRPPDTRGPRAPATFATTADGVRIAYRVVGDEAGIPLLLIAGTGYPAATWTPVSLERLAAGRRVIVFDHRGTGRSGSSDGPYTTRLFASDALAVLEHAGIPSAHVLGHSMGGRVAQWVALDAPERVATLILAATGPGGVSGGGAQAQGVPFHTALGLARDGYRAHLAAQIESTFFTPGFADAEPATVTWLVDAFWRARPTLADYLKHVIARQAHDTTHEVARITPPALVLVGTRDTHHGATGSHLDQSTWLAERLPAGELRTVEGVAHGLFWQTPERALDIITAWLAR